MVFDEISELGSHLSYGFKIDDFIELLQKDEYRIEEEDEKLFEFIENYFNLAKQGYDFYVNRKYPEADANDVLNAFSIIISALIYDFEKSDLQLKDFLKELKIFEEEIQEAKDEGVIKSINLKNSLELFKIISKKLLAQAHKITEGEEDLFEP